VGDDLAERRGDPASAPSRLIDPATPLSIANRAPVPAHAMHLRKPRRSFAGV
jgi:hypothetical protein